MPNKLYLGKEIKSLLIQRKIKWNYLRKLNLFEHWSKIVGGGTAR